jgi:hypothetical protein
MLLEPPREKDQALSYGNRFERALDCTEIGSVMKLALLGYGHSSDPMAWVNFAAAKGWIDYPQNVFHASVSNRYLWAAVSDSCHLRSLVDEVMGRDV